MEERIKDVKTEIVKLLRSTDRDFIEILIVELEGKGFFEAPASRKFHGCFEGGLAEHSLRVFELLDERFRTLKLGDATGNGQKPLPLTRDNIIIAALLHDVCKIGAYIGTEKPYKWNKTQPKGHAALSIKRINAFIKLEPIEEMIIRYHMGVYGLNEFYKKGDWQTGEYNLRGDHIACEGMSKDESKEFRYGKSMANAWFHNPACKVIYFCDEFAAMEEKNKTTGN